MAVVSRQRLTVCCRGQTIERAATAARAIDEAAVDEIVQYGEHLALAVVLKTFEQSRTRGAPRRQRFEHCLPQGSRLRALAFGQAPHLLLVRTQRNAEHVRDHLAA